MLIPINYLAIYFVLTKSDMALTHLVVAMRVPMLPPAAGPPLRRGPPVAAHPPSVRLGPLKTKTRVDQYVHIYVYKIIYRL